MAFRDTSDLHYWGEDDEPPHQVRHRSPASDPTTPSRSAEALRTALAGHGIVADVHQGHGPALLVVRVGLVVWCDGERYWWRTGWDATSRRVIHAWHAATEPVRAARRVALHRTQPYRRHPRVRTDTGRTCGETPS